MKPTRELIAQCEADRGYILKLAKMLADKCHTLYRRLDDMNVLPTAIEDLAVSADKLLSEANAVMEEPFAQAFFTAEAEATMEEAKQVIKGITEIDEDEFESAMTRSEWLAAMLGVKPETAAAIMENLTQ